jgi:hypothetical protein
MISTRILLKKELLTRYKMGDLSWAHIKEVFLALPLPLQGIIALAITMFFLFFLIKLAPCCIDDCC